MKTTTYLTLCLSLLILLLGSTVTREPLVSAPRQSPASSSVTIPADITSYGGIVLQTRINNSRPMWFYLDTGASFPFVIDVRQARLLGLKFETRALGGGGAGPNTYEFAKTRGVSIDLSGLTFKNESAYILALASIAEQLGRSLDGIVGIGLFTRYAVEIDYVGKKIRLYDPQTYTYSGSGESIPLTLRNGHFLVSAKVEMPGRPQLSGRFVIDTGGVLITAVLATPFARSNDLPAATQKTISDRSLAGLGGETKLLIARATSFTLGSSVIPAPVIYLSQDKGGALASSEYDGVIGTEVLRRFKVIFDYRRDRLILERNVHYDEPIEYDMSGISFRAYGDDFRTFRIYQVLEDSPAAEAGLRVRDQLLAVDNVPASRLTLEQIIQMLKVQGREYKLRIKRASATRLMKIKTRRLI